TDGKRDGVARTRVDFLTVQAQFRIERPVPELADGDLREVGAGRIEDVLDEVVRGGAGGLDALHFEGDRLRFESADNDREAAGAVDFLQNEGVCAAARGARRQTQNIHLNLFHRSPARYFPNLFFSSSVSAG